MGLGPKQWPVWLHRRRSLGKEELETQTSGEASDAEHAIQKTVIVRCRKHTDGLRRALGRLKDKCLATPSNKKENMRETHNNEKRESSS